MNPCDGETMEKSGGAAGSFCGERLEAIIGKDVSFSYGEKQGKILDDVSISVHSGSIYALLGPSGCGKTTLLRCIAGYLKPKSGKVLVFGRTPGERGFCIPGHGVGYMPQDLALYPEMTIEEMLTYFAKLYRMDRIEITERISFLVRLLGFPAKGSLIRNLSGGQKRRVSFAIALIHKPPLLLLDEPTVGVDPILRKSIWNYMKRLAEDEYMTIVTTTHYVEEARQAHMVGFMQEGHLLVQKDPEFLIRSYNAATLEEVFLQICSVSSETAAEGLTDLPRNYAKKIDSEAITTANPAFCMPTEDNEKEFDKLDQVETHQSNGNAFNAGEALLSTTSSCANGINESLHRLLTLTAKNFVRLKRNIPLIFFEIFVPMLQVVVFCLCIGGEPFHLPLAVVNLETDPSALGQKFLNTLSNRTFVQERFDDIHTALHSVKVGKTWGVIHIGPSFTESLVDRYIDGATVDNQTITASEISLHLDMTDQQVVSTIYSRIMKGFEEFAKDLLVEFGYDPRIADPTVIIKQPVYGTKNPSFSEFSVPGMIVGITFAMANCLTAMSIITEKKDGLMERFLVAGVTSVEVLGSILLHLFLSMILQVAIVLITTFLVFDIAMLGSVFWVVICVFLVGLSGMAFGLFISTVCRDESAAVMFAMGSFLPNFLLCGIIWPIEGMPVYLRYISYVMPMTRVIRTIRSILLKGWGITDYYIWDGPLISISWTVVFIFIACVVFKYKKT